MQTPNWWLLEMNGGGTFALQSDERPDTTQVIRCPAPEGAIGLSIAANSYRVLQGPLSDELVESMLGIEINEG